MKLATYEHNGQVRCGAVKNGRLVDLTDEFGSVKAILEGGDSAIQRAEAAVAEASDTTPESEVRYRPPVLNPNKLLCLAGNYQSHVEEGGGYFPGKEKTWPRVFMKPPSTTIIGDGDNIVLPQNAQKIDWECELAVVIGKHARFVEPSEGLGCVAGYTVLIDVSERSLKVPDAREDRDGDNWFDWLNGKWFDSFAPCGPVLALKDEIPDPHALSIKLRVSGDTKQDGNTGQMTYSVGELVSWISELVTLEPGDIIATGTLAGVGATTGDFLKGGDNVEGEIEGIGVLKNPVVSG
ncbi:fumarylacetoacetate hydrolase family protein [bacterium]|nr:fumarylacetoacetate hydrolase family protein [bacterium]